jgi:dethiobiotin synthetase
MAKGLFIIGTDTGVGKTLVSALLMKQLRKKGYAACYFKPVLSGAGNQDGRLLPWDTLFVKKLAGLTEDEDSLTPYIFQTPVSPHLAASIESQSIDIEVIKAKYHYLKENYDYLLVEGCGGLAVPLTAGGYMLYDLVKELGLSCLIVARAALGTINHTLLTVRYGQGLDIPMKGIIVNGYTGSIYEDDNVKTIEKLSGLPVIAVIPRLLGIDIENLQTGPLEEDTFNMSILPDIVEWMDPL